MATTALLILDGFGIGQPDPKSNAIYAQGTPNIDRLKAQYSHTSIGTSGLDVGLPDGQMGNSEVGHTNIGAGRVVYQMLVKITKDIEDGVFFENKALLAAMENCKQHDSALHLMGLSPPAACIRTPITSTGFWRWPSATGFPRSTSTASSTAATCRRTPAGSMCRNWWRK